MNLFNFMHWDARTQTQKYEAFGLGILSTANLYAAATTASKLAAPSSAVNMTRAGLGTIGLLQLWAMVNPYRISPLALVIAGDAAFLTQSNRLVAQFREPRVQAVVLAEIAAMSYITYLRVSRGSWTL